MNDLDFAVLNAISKHQRLALDFSHSCDETLFQTPEARKVAKVFIDYVKIYKSKPSRRTLLDRHNTDDTVCDAINSFFDKSDNVEYNLDDYKYDVSKLIQKYGESRLKSVQSKLNQGGFEDVSGTIRAVEKELGAIKAANGQKAYERRVVRNYVDEFRNLYVQKSKNPELGRGLLTGYSFFDYLKNGLRPADLIILAGETGSGKALHINTPIPTPTGWTKMGDLKIGDYVIGNDGAPCKVIETSGIMYNRECYELTFSDGEKIIADSNHEWETQSFKERKKYKKSIKTTKSIIDSLKLNNRKDKRNNHSIINGKPLNLEDVVLPIDPYVLGAWLGDGTSLDGAITSVDNEIINRISESFKITKRSGKYLYGIIGLQTILKKENLFGNKHIPKKYLRSSYNQRLALLQGLMDTDGTISKSGCCEFTTTSELLKEGITELLCTFGITNTCTISDAKLCGKVISKRYRISFTTNLKVFYLSRKAQRIKKDIRFNHRFIVGAKHVDSVPVQCIKVNNDSHMFLCGKSMIPTHNSMFMNNIAIQMWMQENNLETPTDQFKKGCNVTYFSLEMPYEDCFRRSMARLADVHEYGIRDAKLSRAEAKGVSKACKFIKEYPYEFDIVDVPRGFTVEQMEIMFEEIKADYLPDVIFIDYMGLMEELTDADDWLALGKLAGKIHEFARAHSIPVVTAVQLNRIDPANRKNESKAIGLHRIGRSSMIAHHATVIIQIETRQDEETHDDFIYHVIKNRHGQSNKSHSVWKNFNKCSIIDKPYDVGAAEAWTSSEDISEDISDLLGI